MIRTLLRQPVTFLLTKHFIGYDNVFLKDYSYSKPAVCSAPIDLFIFMLLHHENDNYLVGEANVIHLNELN
jgi:hypothetical protein